jgi:type VI protein secretion system component VasK
VGDGLPEIIPTRRIRADRSRRLTVIYAVMVAILTLILVQFLLLMVALEDYLSGRLHVVRAAALGSALCFGGACWLIRYVTARRDS